MGPWSRQNVGSAETQRLLEGALYVVWAGVPKATLASVGEGSNLHAVVSWRCFVYQFTRISVIEIQWEKGGGERGLQEFEILICLHRPLFVLSGV